MNKTKFKGNKYL